jgi:hypothetical protein
LTVNNPDATNRRAGYRTSTRPYCIVQSKGLVSVNPHRLRFWPKHAQAASTPTEMAQTGDEDVGLNDLDLLSCARAIEWARTTPRDQVIARIVSIIQKRGRGEDASTVGYWKTTGIDSTGGVIRERDFQIWIDWLVRAGELKPGELHAPSLFTNEYNPFSNGAIVSKAGP